MLFLASNWGLLSTNLGHVGIMLVKFLLKFGMYQMVQVSLIGRSDHVIIPTYNAFKVL